MHFNRHVGKLGPTKVQIKSTSPFVRGKCGTKRSDIDHLDGLIRRPATRYPRITVKSKERKTGWVQCRQSFCSFQGSRSQWMSLFAGHTAACGTAAATNVNRRVALTCPDCPDCCPDSPGRVPAGRYCNLFFPRLPIPALSSSPLARHTPMPLWVIATRLPQSPPLWTLRCDPKATNAHHTQPEAHLFSTP